jgi:hypothetical protein
VADPPIVHSRFTGSGTRTRFLRDNARAAVDGLFARAFGPAQR